MSTLLHRAIRLGGVLAAAASLAACATVERPSTSIVAQQSAMAPAGFLDLCRRAPGECVDEQPLAPRPQLTPALWGELNAANGAVNTHMRPRTDMEVYGEEEHWASASDPQDRGDCEDFALAKRRLLVQGGVPKSALSLAVVFSARTGRHAILVVQTGQGDFVLDSLSAWVRPWRESGYIFLEKQNSDWRTWSVVDDTPMSREIGFERPVTIAQLQRVAGEPATATAALASRP